MNPMLVSVNVIVFKCSALFRVFCDLILEDWRCDQYRWFQNGDKKLPTSQPIIRNKYFIADTSEGRNSGFKRHSYALLDSSKLSTLVHYIGDDSIGLQHPHGNSKNQKPYIKTCPSVLRSMSKIQDSPSTIYKQMVQAPQCLPEEQPVLFPRNVKQIKNLQAKDRQCVRLTHDALSMYNVHELAYDLGDFVYKIITFPDLIIVCGLNVVLQELNRIISAVTKTPILLPYDTTFQLGDFYVSPLLFRHVLFNESPIIPAAFMLHERKFQSAHEEFMKYISMKVPSLSKLERPIPIVTDAESGICNAIDKCLPGVHRLQCWNHLINSIKMWLRRHGATSAEIPVYVSHLRQLFHQETEDSYNKMLTQLQSDWSKAFLDHYMQNIHLLIIM